MSEDRLEKALEALRNESVTEEESANVRARVWERLAASAQVCGEFRAQLKEYLVGRLPESRRLLMEDHLGRCAECRRQFAAVKDEARGERKVVAMPPPIAGSWPRWKAWAVAASLALVAVYTGRHQLDAWLAPGGPRMTVEMVSGDLYRLPEGVLQPRAGLGEGEVVRTGVGARALLRLADGSAVEMNERSELYVRAAWSGQTVHLQRGDIIVQAAGQRRGRLRVQTRDSVASVRGTVFAVSAGITGSLVSVLEGTVEVSQPGSERLLKPGEQAASNPALQSVPLRQAVAWSKDSEKYLALLSDLAKLEQQIAAIPPPALRTQPRLVQYLPANAVVYGALPNLAGTIRQALAFADQRAVESQVFREWWNSDAVRELRELVDRAQEVTPLLGEEIGFVLAQSAPDSREQIPMLLAEVQASRQEALAKALQALRVAGNARLFYYADRILVMSDSQAHLQWALSHLGRGASGPFAGEIARRYQRGAGWLLAIDLSAMNLPGRRGPAAEVTGAGPMKRLFLERRASQGVEENEAILTFEGARTGIASWLASAGNSGAAEYISSDAILAFSASTREPRQVFDEFMAQIAKIEPGCREKLQEMEARLGIRVADDIAAAIGTDFAVAIERLSVPVPGWVAAVAVYQPSRLDATIRKLVDVFNNHLKPEDQSKRLVLEQETVNGRAWNTLKSGGAKVPVTWTYHRGYLVAGAERALAARAIATREGGFPLIWTAAFRTQLPATVGLHPSGFAWLNTRGALEGLAAFFPAGALKDLASNRDPVVAVVNGEAEQIRVLSRTRFTSLILGAMMAEAAAGAGGRASAVPATRGRSQ